MTTWRTEWWRSPLTWLSWWVSWSAPVSFHMQVSHQDVDHMNTSQALMMTTSCHSPEHNDVLKSLPHLSLSREMPSRSCYIEHLVYLHVMFWCSGSLLNLAKHPASTVQILGAEKALFRALKTRKDTPKYGLIYHASLVGQTAAKNKGKVRSGVVLNMVQTMIGVK